MRHATVAESTYELHRTRSCFLSPRFYSNATHTKYKITKHFANKEVQCMMLGRWCQAIFSSLSSFPHGGGENGTAAPPPS